ncbi:MAG: MATE family efflux transporter [Devosia sp.]|nr:MATE family efflux transporter [Devosia sp.]
MTRPSYPFDVRSRDVWAIALPASVAFITEPLAGLVDITVIGRQGDAALLGGVVIGALIFDFIFSLAYFLRIGTAGLTAQAIGARDPHDGLLHVVRAIGIAVIVGLAMIVLQIPLLDVSNLAMAPSAGVAEAFAAYFHVRIWAAPFSLINYALLGWFYGRAAAKTGMMLQLIIHITNIVLSVGLVYGLGWGVTGVALGTVLGQVAAAGLGLYLLARHFGGVRRLVSLIVPGDLLHGHALNRMFGLSRDLMIRSLALMSAYAWFAAQGSRMGEVPLSANAILLNFLMISGFFLDGIAQAAEQLCGKAVGANWRPAYESAYGLSFRWGTLLALGLAIIWFLGGWFLIDFMTTSEPVRAYARGFLWIAALSSLTGMPAFVYDGILVGSTLNVVMRNGMVAALGIFLVAAIPLQAGLGNTGLWVAIHIFFVARAGFYWWALERKKAGLFTA